MAREIMTFCQNLGHDEVGFYGDNEPTVRALLRVLLNSRHALGLRTRIYTTRVRDSAGNSLAENAVQRIRGLACTMLEDLMSRIGVRLNSNHGLWSWAARHACWAMNRYQATRGVTGYELVHGKSYTGTIVPYGCPVYAYVRPQGGKGDPKWRMALFLGKTENQDAWVVGDGEQVMLTRSVRRVDRPWSKFLAYYQNFNTYSWEYQMNFGGRIVPSKRAVGPMPLKDGQMPPMDTILVKFRDEEAEAVEAYALSREGKEESLKEIQEAADELNLALVGLPAPSAPRHEVAEPGQPVTPPLQSVQVPVDEMEVQQMSPLPWEVDEQPRQQKRTPPPANAAPSDPQAKRSRTEEPISSSMTARMEMVLRRIETVKIDGGEYHHMDTMIGSENVVALEEDWKEPSLLEPGVIPDELWSEDCLSREPPQPLPEVDRLADAVEELRLKSLGVIRDLLQEESHFDLLTTRSVYDWRIKMKKLKTGKQEKKWLRRSRLVAREYANSKRDDVHSPTSSAHSLRLLPLLFLSERSREFSGRQVVLGALDIKDAFLQVPQEENLQIVAGGKRYRVLKNLPGQRLGAKAWYTYLTNFLSEKGFMFHTENPCLGKLKLCEEEGSVFVLIHVDDLMFYGDVAKVNSFIQVLKSKFEISISQMKDVGEEFQFLKRTYRLESDGLAVKPGRYSDDMIENYEKAYGPVNAQKLPAGPEIKDTDGSDLLDAEHASLFRSLVGSGIYLAQERLDIAFTIKELAASMSNPTASSMAKMKRLVGYLKETKDQYMHLPYPVRGQGIVIRSGAKWLLETFADADWSGSRGHRRSTSAGVHAINGLIVFASSRGQKVVSLSSSESELHALVSGACDGIFIKSTMVFLVNEEVHHACLLDNLSTRQIAQKRGSGKLRHVSGKLLWCQDKVATKEMEVIQVSTSKNISDIGTKALSQMRLKLLMFWCNMRSADGARIGEQEFQEEEERQRQKGNVMRLAKLLNRMVLSGGLGQATAERMSIEEELLQQQPEETWRRWLAVILFLIVLMLVGFINLVRKEKRLRDEVENIRTEQERLQMELREQRAEQSRCESMTHDYIENVHLGLVAMGGYLDPALPSLTEADRHQRSFLQMGNRTRDILRLGRQRRSYIRGILRRRNESPVSSRSAEKKFFPETQPLWGWIPEKLSRSQLSMWARLPMSLGQHRWQQKALQRENQNQKVKVRWGKSHLCEKRVAKMKSRQRMRMLGNKPQRCPSTVRKRRWRNRHWASRSSDEIQISPRFLCEPCWELE